MSKISFTERLTLLKQSAHDLPTSCPPKRSLPSNDIDEIYCPNCGQTFYPRDFVRVEFN